MRIELRACRDRKLTLMRSKGFVRLGGRGCVDCVVRNSRRERGGPRPKVGWDRKCDQARVEKGVGVGAVELQKR